VVISEVLHVSEIRRYGTSRRWADVVVHRGVARWVEVAEDTSRDARGQIAQVLAQVDATLEAIGSDRTRLLEVLVFLATASDSETLNELWDAWVPAGHTPARATIESNLAAPKYRVEIKVIAAV
jgi:enamine deaminase RidA (YjgF/YER057c/UK114 family)